MSFSTDSFFRIWDVPTGAFEEAYELQDFTHPLAGSTNAVGNQWRRAVVGEDGVVRVLDMKSDDVIAEFPGLANAVVWNAEGTLLGVAMANGTVQIWKAG